MCCQIFLANLQTGIRAARHHFIYASYFFLSLVNLFVYYAKLAFLIMIV